MTRSLTIPAFALALLAAPAVAADERPAPPYLDPEKRAEAERLALDGLDQLMRAFDSFLAAIPQYETPQITPEGDIIIRRRNPVDPERRPLDPDETAI